MTTTAAAAEVMAYVGFAPCGCARALTVDGPEARREQAKGAAA